MIIDGKEIAEGIHQEIKEQVARIQGRTPCLAVVLVGNHPPSQIYVNRKKRACASVGIQSVGIDLSSNVSENLLIKTLEDLNSDPKIDGILLQLPLPSHINTIKILNHISPDKDVDGLHPYNLGKLLMGDTDGFFPCTPFGIKIMLERSHIELEGKNVLIIGRSNLVGKPLAALLMQNAPGANATVTIAHSKTKNLKELALRSDIIVAAIGQPRMLTAEMVSHGCVVVDVGINKINDPSAPGGYRIIGDVDFDYIKDKCSHITPVPGGVGPMTIAMLLSNTWKSYQKRI